MWNDHCGFWQQPDEHMFCHVLAPRRFLYISALCTSSQPWHHSLRRTSLESVYASLLVCFAELEFFPKSFYTVDAHISAEYFQFLHSEWTLIFGTGCLSYKQGVKELWGPKCSIADVEHYCNPVALGQALHFQFIGLLRSCTFIHTLHCPFSF